MGFPGSQRNVQKLVDAHYTHLYRYAYRLTGSPDDAAELTQETFCKAQRNLAQLREPDRAKAWLFSILRNAYLHKMRANKQARCLPLDAVGDIAEAAPRALSVLRTKPMAPG